jgi:hypothetical protein
MITKEANGELVSLLGQQVDALQQQSDSMAPGQPNPVIDFLRETGKVYAAGMLSEAALCYGAMTAYWQNRTRLQGTIAGSILGGLGHELAAAASLPPDDVAYFWESAEQEPRIAAIIQRARAAQKQL